MVDSEYLDFEIIVVDYSTNGIKEFITSNYPQVKLVELSGEDVGPSCMHNIGIENADTRSKYIAFLDNDTIVERGWLHELVSCIETDDNIGAIQSKILIYDENNILNTRGNRANYLAVGWPEGYGEKDVKNDKLKEIAFPSGASVIFRRTSLERVGSYDNDYFIYCDDLDVGLRLRLAGYKILYNPKSIVYHKYKFLKSKRNFYYLNRNRIMTFLKLYERNTYLKMLPPILLYEFFVSSYSILDGCLGNLLKAYLHVFRNRKSIIQKRKEVKKYKCISDGKLIEFLDGGIYFSVTLNPAVKYILNPFLEWYKRNILLRGNKK